ncbi:hypothetical protein Tco_1549304 [Tanacetum coccineum]
MVANLKIRELDAEPGSSGPVGLLKLQLSLVVWPLVQTLTLVENLLPLVAPGIDSESGSITLLAPTGSSCMAGVTKVKPAFNLIKAKDFPLMVLYSGRTAA